MYLRPLLLLAAPVVAAPAVASEGVDIRSVHRITTAGGAAGDQAAADEDESDRHELRWSSALAVDLDDRRRRDLAGARSVQHSLVEARNIAAVLDVRAEIARGAEADAGSELAVMFDVREQVRFTLAADARSSRGVSSAALRIDRGGFPHLDFETRSGGREVARRFGWLQPDQYRLDAHGVVVAMDGPDDEAASLAFNLQFLHAADMDLDGDVDPEDLHLFARVFSAGTLHADFDGDGRLAHRDARQFMQAYNGATVPARAELERANERDRATRDGLEAGREELTRGTRRMDRDAGTRALERQRTDRAPDRNLDRSQHRAVRRRR